MLIMMFRGFEEAIAHVRGWIHSNLFTVTAKLPYKLLIKPNIHNINLDLYGLLGVPKVYHHATS